MKHNLFFFLCLFLTIIIIFLKPIFFKKENVFLVLDYSYLLKNYKITKVISLEDFKIYYLYTDYFTNFFPGDVLTLKDYKIKDNNLFFPKQVVYLSQSKIYFGASLRNYLKEKIEKNLPWPEENILRGIIFGDEIEDYDLKENFKKLGVSHLFVASGGNLIIFTSIIYSLFKNFSFLKRKIVVFFIFLLLIFYVIVVGFEGSILRAGIFLLFFLLIKDFSGRIVLVRNIIIFSIFLITLISPFILLELGTILSYFSFLGIVYLAPFIESEIKNFLKNKFLVSFLAPTLSVFLFTFPIINYFFQEINFYSLFFNFIFIPLVTFIFYLGLIFAFLPYFNKILILPLNFLIHLSSLANYLPSFSFSFPPIFLIFYYSLLLTIVYKINKNENIEFNFNLR